MFENKSLTFDNPLLQQAARSEILKGKIDFLEEVQSNLRQQIDNLRKLLVRCGVDREYIDMKQYEHLNLHKND